MNLNARAVAVCESMIARSVELQIAVSHLACGTTLIDCGVAARGGLIAGVALAQVCLADLAEIAFEPSGEWGGPIIHVRTDEPLLACMASQYAGWEIKGEKYFAMGSGPMRAAAAREPLFDEIGYQETAEACVGVLESGKLPPEAACVDIAAKCRIPPANLTLLVAPTRSMAGMAQIAARSVETAMHKLHELKFDLKRIVSGQGAASLPASVPDDLAAIGMTNDAILYGGEVTLSVRGDDASLEEIGPRVPSSASSDYGRPFAEILAGYNNDFYRVDPLLFSPARITLSNLDTGHSFQYGELNRDVLAKSFGVGS